MAGSEMVETPGRRFLGLSRLCLSTEQSMSAKDTLATDIQLLCTSTKSSSEGICSGCSALMLPCPRHQIFLYDAFVDDTELLSCLLRTQCCHCSSYNTVPSGGIYLDVEACIQPTIWVVDT